MDHVAQAVLYMAKLPLDATSTFIRSERAGTLTVECTNAMWAQELDLMQGQLLERLREALGERAPQALKFRVARGA